jgi:hypothetical protein
LRVLLISDSNPLNENRMLMGELGVRIRIRIRKKILEAKETVEISFWSGQLWLEIARNQ